MMQVNYESVAKKIVNKCMRVKEGEVIVVRGGIHNFELAEKIAVNVRKKGAFVLFQTYSDELTRRMYQEVPMKYLKKTPKFWLKWYEDVDGAISIDPTCDPRSLSAVSESRMGAAREGSRKIQDKFIQEEIRWTGMGYPTKELAATFGVPYAQFWDMFWKAVNVNYDKLYERGKTIAKAFKGADKVHLTSKKGTDLTFSVKNRKPLIDDGVISPEDIRNKDVGNNLPCGEVFFPPVETSANGRAVFDLAFRKGKKIEDIDVTFKKGRIVKAKAKKNEKLFKEVIKNSQGDKDRIGEFGIGINPKVTKAIGYVITDEKIIGTIHIAVGENRMFGGKNESTLHWDMVMMKPDIEVDGKKIMSNGKFLI
jgi:aminopeptidase